MHLLLNHIRKIVRIISDLVISKVSISVSVITSLPIVYILLFADVNSFPLKAVNIPKFHIDDRANLILQNYHLMKHGEDQPIVAMLGGSTLREIIFNLEYFEKKLIKFQRTVPVYDFTTSGQPMSLSQSIADRVLCARTGIIVIAVNQDRPAEKVKSEVSFGDDLNFFDDQFKQFDISDVENRSYLYKVFVMDPLPVDKIIKYSYRTLIKILRNTDDDNEIPNFSKKETIYRHYYTSTEIPSETKINRLVLTEKNPDLASFRNQLNFYRKLEDFIIKMNNCSNFEIILVIPGVHPRLIDDPLLAKEFAEHKAILLEFLKYTNVHFLDLNDFQKFEYDDFADLVHLRSLDAILQSSSILINKIAQVLEI